LITCPSCNNAITIPQKYCAHCGHSFVGAGEDSLARHFGMLGEIESLRHLGGQINSSIESLEGRLIGSEESINAELREKCRPDESVSEVDFVSGEPDVSVFEQEEIGAFEGFGDEAQQQTPFATANQPDERVGKSGSGQSFELQMGLKWILIAGIVTMVFGVAYFLKYSFEQGWVGPAGRVVMAYVWGVVFLVAGDRFRQKSYKLFGLSLVGGGIATLYFAAFAGFQIYGLVGQVPTLIIMVAVTALACTLSLYYDTIWLAILGLAGGYLTPLMLRTGVPNYPFLFTYLTLLNSAMLLIAMRRGWMALAMLGQAGGFILAASVVLGNSIHWQFLCYVALMAVSFMLVSYRKRWYVLGPVSFFVTFFLFYFWYQAHFRPDMFLMASVFINTIFLLYSVGPFVYSLMEGQDEQAVISSQAVIGLATLFAAGFNYDMIKDLYRVEWVSLPFVVYAALFIVFTSRIYSRYRTAGAAFVVYIGYASALLVLAVAFLFSGHWLTVFWAAEAIVLLWLGSMLNRKPLVWAAYAFVVFVSCKFVFYDYVEVFRLGSDITYIPGFMWEISGRLITTITVLGAPYAAARLSARARLGHFAVMGERHFDHIFFYFVFGLLLFIAANIETSAFFGQYLRHARFAAISVVWTLFSVCTMVLGFRYRTRWLRMLSLCLFCLTLIKVFFVDISNVDTPFRILSFIVLGLVLIGTSFLYHRFRDRIMEVFAVDSEKSDV